MKSVNTWQDLGGGVVIGIIGGIMGAFFVGVNFKVNAYRKTCLKSNWIKPFETMGWSIATSLSFVLIPFIMYATQEGLC